MQFDTVNPAQSDLFYLVDIDMDGKELFRTRLDCRTRDFRKAYTGKPPHARARYIWAASRGPDVPKPKPLSALRTRLHRSHPPRELTHLNQNRSMLVDIVQHIESRLRTETGSIIVHLFHPEPLIRGAGRLIHFNAELRSALSRHGRIEFRYVDPADWALS